MSEKAKDILEWCYCIVIALILALLFRYFIGTPTIVMQRSMYPTLQEGQRLALNRTFRITKPNLKVGQIITFEAPSREIATYEADQSNPKAIYDNNPEGIINKFVYYVLELTKKSYIKRVIALEGDHVQIKDDAVYVNGNKLKEDYLKDDVITTSNVFTDFIVPEGYVFALGDNRQHSTDCRKLGCIPIEKVEGIVMFRFWPFSEFGKIDK